jgi:MSHA biogenesis protein MshJ
MKQQWEMISAKLEAMSLRERVFIFAALAALLLALINMLLLEPLFARQKSLRSQLAQQQQMLSAVQSQIAAMQQDNSADANSPQLNQIKQLKQEIAEGNAFLQSSRERLVQPEKMAAHLRQLLNKNNRLKIIALQTLPVTTLIEQPDISGNAQAASQEKQIFKHGVQLALRGNYLDLLQYLSALEKLPQQMYWAKAKMSVVEYPASELTLTLYTLSLDKTWLQI